MTAVVVDTGVGKVANGNDDSTGIKCQIACIEKLLCIRREGGKSRRRSQYPPRALII